MLGLGLGLGIGGPYGAASAPAFDPATLTLSGWWRAPYAGSPVSGETSAGNSTLRTLSHATNAPDVGATLNGYATMDFIRANTDRLTASGTMTNYLSATGGSVACLFWADSTTATGNLFEAPALFAPSAVAYAYFGFDASGLRGGVHDGTGYKESVTACTTGGWRFGMYRYNASFVESGLNGTWSTPTAIARGPNTFTETMQVGKATSAAYFDGRIAEIFVASSKLTDDDFNNLKSYCNSRYGLSL